MKIISIFCYLIIFTSVVVPSALFAETESVQLAYRLQKGDLYLFETTMDQNILMPIPGIPVQDLHIEHVLDFGAETLSVDSQGNASMEIPSQTIALMER